MVLPFKYHLDHRGVGGDGASPVGAGVRLVQATGDVQEGRERDEGLGEDGPWNRANLHEHDASTGTLSAPSRVRAVRGGGLLQEIQGGLGPHLRAGAIGAEAAVGGGPGQHGGLGGDMEIMLD